MYIQAISGYDHLYTYIREREIERERDAQSMCDEQKHHL